MKVVLFLGAKNRDVILIFSLGVLLPITILVPSMTSTTFAQNNVLIREGSGANQDCGSTQTCFSPPNMYVQPSQTVTWFNADSVAHTVTSGNPSDNQRGTIFDSKLISAGKTFNFTFQKADAYPYFCEVHPWMTGLVTVSTEPPPPQIEIRSISNRNPLWDSSISISGTALNHREGDYVNVKWGDGSNSMPIPISNSEWGAVSHQYGSTSIGSKSIVAELHTHVPGLENNIDVVAAQASTTISVQKHRTNLIINNINNVSVGGTITVAGRLVDPDAQNQGISGRTVTFSGTGVGTLQATTDPTGSFQLSTKAPAIQASGLIIQAHFAGDSSYENSDSQIQKYDTTSEVRISVSTDKLEYTTGDSITISGTVTGAVSQQPEVILWIIDPNGITTTVSTNLDLSSGRYVYTSTTAKLLGVYGQYQVIAKYRLGSVNEVANTAFGYIIGNPSTSITVQSDKSIYDIGNTVYISGTVKPVVLGQTITITVTYQNGNVIYTNSNIVPDQSGNFSVETSNINDKGTYSITASYNGASGKAGFTVEKSPIIPSIKVRPDKSTYDIGNTVYISGTVKPVVPSQAVTIIISDPNNNRIYSIDNIVPDKESGYYSAEFSLSGIIPQTYTVKATYLSSKSLPETFEVKPPVNPIIYILVGGGIVGGGIGGYKIYKKIHPTIDVRIEIEGGVE